MNEGAFGSYKIIYSSESESPFSRAVRPSMGLQLERPEPKMDALCSFRDSTSGRPRAARPRITCSKGIRARTRPGAVSRSPQATASEPPTSSLGKRATDSVRVRRANLVYYVHRESRSFAQHPFNLSSGVTAIEVLPVAFVQEQIQQVHRYFRIATSISPRYSATVV